MCVYIYIYIYIGLYSQHQTQLQLRVASTLAPCFLLSGASSKYPLLFPVSYWTPSDLGGSSSGVKSLCLFILFVGFSRQEHRSGLPCPPPVDLVLSELSTVTRPSWVALPGKAPGVTELQQPLWHDKALIREGVHAYLHLHIYT